PGAAAAPPARLGSAGALAGPGGGPFFVAIGPPPPAPPTTVVCFSVSILMCRRLSPVPPAEQAAKPSWRGIAEGARYAWSRPVLLGTYAIDLAAMFFAFPNTIFPFLADELDADWSLGLMYSAGAVGSLVVSLTSGWASRTQRHGLLVVFGAAGWGLAMAAAGWTSQVWLVLVCLALAGAGDMVSGLGRSTIWNQTIPDRLRGRLAGIEVLSYSVGPQLGQVRAGAMAGWTGARPAIWTGGLACVAAVGLLTAALPKLISYDARTDEDAARRRAEEGVPGRTPDPAGPGPQDAGPTALTPVHEEPLHEEPRSP
ncbi:MFS transporter, partial [Streptomyces sp. WG7]|uniref:MFS transporter n=1 Tax=Streptomyces sp. WG7 TaxID=3417650 RepID=UPI003CF691B0